MSVKMSETEMEALYNKAMLAGKVAMEFCGVEEMRDACGFAWVNVRPGTSRFAKFLKAKKYARSDEYYGGVTIWIRGDGGQSVRRKEAYADAVASVMSDAGVDAYSMSRLD